LRFTPGTDATRHVHAVLTRDRFPAGRPDNSAGHPSSVHVGVHRRSPMNIAPPLVRAESDMSRPPSLSIAQLADETGGFARRAAARSRITARSHLYRGELYRSTVWRTRLDTTTNWAVVATGLVPHFSRKALAI